MSKTSILFFLGFILLSCGRERLENSASLSVGGFRQIESVIASETDQQKWKDLCDTLTEKSRIYNEQYKKIYTRFHFTTTYYGCNGFRTGDDGKIIAKLALNAPDLVYEIVSGTRFYSDVETHDKGLLGILCGEVRKGGALSFPVKKGELYYWFNWGAPSCRPSGTETCVTVETLMKVNEMLKEITEDRFTISLAPTSLGNVSYHHRVDASSCPEGKTIQIGTSLDSIINN